MTYTVINTTNVVNSLIEMAHPQTPFPIQPARLRRAGWMEKMSCLFVFLFSSRHLRRDVGRGKPRSYDLWYMSCGNVIINFKVFLVFVPKRLKSSLLV